MIFIEKKYLPLDWVLDGAVGAYVSEETYHRWLIDIWYDRLIREIYCDLGGEG